MTNKTVAASPRPALLDPTGKPIQLENNTLVIEKRQEITDDYLNEIKDDRHDAKHNRAREFHRVASIPVALVEQWKQQGFDIHDPNVKAKDILARLRREDLSAFITSDKLG